MSAINFDPISRGNARSAASLNAFYTAFEALEPLVAANYREDGIGRKALGAQSHGDRVFEIEETTRVAAAAVITGAAYAQFAMGATVFRYTGAPLVLAANEILVLRGRVVLNSLVAAGNQGLAPASIFGLRIRHSLTAVVTSPNRSQREIQTLAAGTRGLHWSIGTLGWIGGPASIDWVELQYRLSANTAWPGIGQFYGHRLRRVTV